MNRKIRLLQIAGVVSVALALVVVGVALAANKSVDPFDEGDYEVKASPSNKTVTNVYVDTVPITILGGERDVVVNHISGGGYVSVQIDLWDTNKLAFNQDDGIKGNATITWDGVDGNATERSYSLNENLTAGGNDSFLLRIPSNDSSVDITIRVYTTDSDHWSDYTFRTPGGIQSTSAVDLVIPYNLFSQRGTYPVTWTDVDAIELYLDGSVTEGADMSIDFFEASNYRDYGDLPESGSPSYPGLTTGTDPARHYNLTLRLGQHADAEANGQPNSAASGDDTAGTYNDEDGVARTPGVFWHDGSPLLFGGSIDFAVNGCGNSKTCYINGWIDWNNDGVFDPGEQILTDSSVVDGSGATNRKTFTIPDDASIGEGSIKSVYARFRLCPDTSGIGSCNSLTGEAANGEVEDFHWSFGPTTVTLSSIKTHSVGELPLLALAGLGLLAVSGVCVLVWRRRKA